MVVEVRIDFCRAGWPILVSESTVFTMCPTWVSGLANTESETTQTEFGSKETWVLRDKQFFKSGFQLGCKN